MALFDGFTLPPTKGTEQYRAPDDPRGGKPDLGSDMKQDTGLPSWMQEEVFGPKGGGSGGAVVCSKRKLQNRLPRRREACK